MTDRKDIKLLIVDIDGTLLTSKQELSPRTEAALKAAVQHGVMVVLATGKSRAAGQYVIDRVGLKTPGIYLQGLALHDAEDVVLYKQTLDTDIVRQIVTYADDRGFAIVAYGGGRIMTKQEDARVHYATTRVHEPAPEVIGALQNVLGRTPINKLIIIDTPKRVRALRWQLAQQHGKSIKLTAAGLPEFIEVIPPGTGKGTAMVELLKHVNIALENVMAIGDGENDIEMIQMAGFGVAMGQAEQAVKDAADYVTATNDEDGAAQAIERFILPAVEEKAEGEAVAPMVVMSDAEATASIPETETGT